MNQPAVTIHLVHEHHEFHPGDVLTGEYWLSGCGATEVTALEVSVLWHTEGKGDEDLAVHYFKRLSRDAGELLDPLAAGKFSVILPNSPLSYEGVIVKLRWLVRVRMFLSDGKEVVAERGFQLGHVPPARAVLPARGAS